MNHHWNKEQPSKKCTNWLSYSNKKYLLGTIWVDPYFFKFANNRFTVLSIVTNTAFTWNHDVLRSMTPQQKLISPGCADASHLHTSKQNKQKYFWLSALLSSHLQCLLPLLKRIEYVPSSAYTRRAGILRRVSVKTLPPAALFVAVFEVLFGVKTLPWNMVQQSL